METQLKIIVLRTKYGDIYYRASTPEEMEIAGRKILEYNKNFYEGPFLEKVEEELKNPSGKAWRLAQSRSRHEYEEVEIENVD